MKLLRLLLPFALGVYSTPLEKKQQQHARGACEEPDVVVANGDFEGGDRTPWTFARGSVLGSVKKPGSNANNDSSVYSLRSANLIDNNLWTIYQYINTCAGTTYTCTYDWYFDEYHETKYKDGIVYVPYIHTYVNYDQGNHDAIGVRSLFRGRQKHWQRNTVTFQANGSDVLEFDLASPQPRRQGCNYARIDNIACTPAGGP